MDDELLTEFVVEANEHLADVENQFLAIEASGDNVDVDLVNEVFRAVHSIKGAAGFLGLTVVNDLAHSLENILNMMRNSELCPNSEIVDVMLRAADELQGLINDIENSNSADVSTHIAALEAIANGNSNSSAASAPATEAPAENLPIEESANGAGELPSTEVDEDELDKQIAAAFAAKQGEQNSQPQNGQVQAEQPQNNAPAPAKEAPAATNKEAVEKKTVAPRGQYSRLGWCARQSHESGWRTRT